MSEELEQKIQALERRLKREKAARKTAESQLEEFARKIYYSNQALQESVTNVQRKQAELEFLANASSSTSSESNFSELISTTLELTSKFSNAEFGTCFFTNKGKKSDIPIPFIWSKKGDISDFEQIPQELIDLVPVDESEVLENWIVQDIADLTDFELKWFVGINFKLTSEVLGWIVFFIDSEFIDEDTLFVLDTSKLHLRNAVTRHVQSKNIFVGRNKLNETAKHLATARKQLVQAERLASLGQLAAGVAHEINNPVGFIKSNTYTLKTYLEQVWQFIAELKTHSQEPAKKHLAYIEKLEEQYDLAFMQEDVNSIIQDNTEGLQRIEEIVANLKSFSNLTKQKEEQFNLDEYIAKAIKISWNTIKNKHKVDLKLDKNLPLLKGDPGEIQQVFINLIVNAGQAMQTSGEITISSEVDGDFIVAKVTDSGKGMDDKTMKKLFTPFFTTKSVGEGTGLGLSVSKAIVESFGGEIWAESVLGKGTTMFVKLPLKQ